MPFFIQVCWDVQLPLLSLALFTALGERCWNEVKSPSLHLCPGECTHDVSNWAQQLSWWYGMSPFIAVVTVMLVMDAIRTRNSLGGRHLSPWRCSCGVGGEVCAGSWGGGCCGGGRSSEQKRWPPSTFGCSRDPSPPPFPFPEILLAAESGGLKMVLSCLYHSVQDCTSHLYIDSKFVFPFSCASPGTGSACQEAVVTGSVQTESVALQRGKNTPFPSLLLQTRARVWVEMLLRAVTPFAMLFSGSTRH